MEGYLGKKGKRMGSRVRRFMRLDGALLSNHHDEGTAPTWRVNVKDATISSNTKRHRIVIELYNNKLELYAETSRECQEWYDALKSAKNKANLDAKNDPNKENEGAENEKISAMKMASTTEDSIEHKESNVMAELGKNFKVVKPTARTQSVYSSDGSDEAHQGDQPLVVQGQAYEETPASMIFKQFNFPAK